MELDRLAYQVNEVADMLGVSRSRMYALMTSGDMFYIQPQGHRMIPAEAIRAFLRGERYEPNAGQDRAQHADTTTWPPTPSLLASETVEGAFHGTPGDYGAETSPA